MRTPGWLTARPAAHRGYHDREAGRLENTLPAVAAAIEKNFAVEVDVRLTADGRVVVFHDADLGRLTDRDGRVADQNLSALREARMKGADAGIPTLEELLDLVAGRTPLLLEMKMDRPGAPALGNAVADALATYDGPVAAMSFDHEAIARLRRRAPTLLRGLVAGGYRRADYPALAAWRRLAYRHLASAAVAVPHFVAYDVRRLPASGAQSLRHFFKVPLLTWTVRTAEERATAAQWADQMIFEGFDPDAAPPPSS